MPIESATYIHDLDQAQPVHTDGLNQVDSHLRLLKATLQNTLPNFTGPVTGTPAQLNALAAMAVVPGQVLIPAGNTGASIVKMKGVAGAGSVLIQNNAPTGAPGLLTISINDQADANTANAMTLTKSGVLTIPTAVNTTSLQQGGFALIPRGIITLWSGSFATVPTGWHLCDGTNGTPNLTDRFIVGAGQSFVVAQTGGAASVTAATDAQGTHNHLGVTAFAGPFAMTATTDAQGQHVHGGAVGATALNVSMLPPHTHGIANGAGSGVTFGGSPGLAGGSATSTDGGAGLAGAAHSHSISADGSHAHNVSVSNAPTHQHGIVNDGTHVHSVNVPTMPPFYALAYIMKL